MAGASSTVRKLDPAGDVVIESLHRERVVFSSTHPPSRVAFRGPSPKPARPSQWALGESARLDERYLADTVRRSRNGSRQGGYEVGCVDVTHRLSRPVNPLVRMEVGRTSGSNSELGCCPVGRRTLAYARTVNREAVDKRRPVGHRADTSVTMTESRQVARNLEAERVAS